MKTNNFALVRNIATFALLSSIMWVTCKNNNQLPLELLSKKNDSTNIAINSVQENIGIVSSKINTYQDMYLKNRRKDSDNAVAVNKNLNTTLSKVLLNQRNLKHQIDSLESVGQRNYEEVKKRLDSLIDTKK